MPRLTGDIPGKRKIKVGMVGGGEVLFLPVTTVLPCA